MDYGYTVRNIFFDKSKQCFSNSSMMLSFSETATFLYANMFPSCPAHHCSFAFAADPMCEAMNSKPR